VSTSTENKTVAGKKIIEFPDKELLKEKCLSPRCSCLEPMPWGNREICIKDTHRGAGKKSNGSCSGILGFLTGKLLVGKSVTIGIQKAEVEELKTEDGHLILLAHLQNNDYNRTSTFSLRIENFNINMLYGQIIVSDVYRTIDWIFPGLN